MKITEIRTRVVEWRGQDRSAAAAFLHQSDGPAASLPARLDGQVPLPRLADRRDLHRHGPRRHRQRGALRPRVTKQTIDLYLEPLLIGADPWDIEFLWQHMYRKTMAFGRKGIGMAAISAVDIALWDLLGKAAGATGLPAAGRAHQADGFPSMPAACTASRSMNWRPKRRSYKDAGYKAMKLRFGWGPIDGADGMQRNVDLVRTVREVVGDGVDIMADAYMGWTLDYARRMIPLLEPFRLRWLEEAVIPDDLHGYASLKAIEPRPDCGRRARVHALRFRDLLDARALDYIQFDTNRVGGITQARKIAALAESYSVPVVPHAGQMHNYHVVMASLNSPMAEFFPPVDVEVGNELFWYIFDGEPSPTDGYIDLRNDLPGLGLTIKEEALGKFDVIE